MLRRSVPERSWPKPWVALFLAFIWAGLTADFARAQATPNAEPDTTPSNTPITDPTLIGPTTEWQICNETSYVVRTSSAFLRAGRMIAKGWDEILPGSCIALITPQTGPRFLFAESLDLHQGGVREWKGTTPLCVADDADFESDATDDCRLTNKATRDHFAVRPGEPITRLVEPSEYGEQKSIIAGQQRLLRDAGYDISRIDGLAGRKTSRLLREFRRDAGLDSNVTGEPLLQAMMLAAANNQAAVGLEVCNQSTATIWAAIATREDGQWRSRGWWQATAGECMRPLDVPITDTAAHLFAVQEAPEGPDLMLRTSAPTPTQFCIGEAKFDAIGNEMCLEQGYTAASFRPVPTDMPGARVRLSDSDFATPAPGGLRR